MTKKRIASLLLVLVMLVGALVIAPTASAVTNEVSLIYAKPMSETIFEQQTGQYIRTDIWAEGYVEVLNLGYVKNVTIHYSNDNGSTWQDVAATYYKPTHGNYEAWKFVTPVKSVGMRSGASFDFAIKYQVNGQTYWDNNNGENYYVYTGYAPGTTMAIGNGGVALNDSTFRPDFSNPAVHVLSGSVMLKNIDYNKVVKIRYSTDDWATYQEAALSYSSTVWTYRPGNVGPSDLEYWTFSVNLPSSATTVQFAISYTVNGTTYWDNNFGDNYTMNADW